MTLFLALVTTSLPSLPNSHTYRKSEPRWLRVLFTSLTETRSEVVTVVTTHRPVTPRWEARRDSDVTRLFCPEFLLRLGRWTGLRDSVARFAFSFVASRLPLLLGASQRVADPLPYREIHYENSLFRQGVTIRAATIRIHPTSFRALRY